MKTRVISDKLKELKKKKSLNYEDREGDNISQELLRIEIICTAVHYAEVFASVLLAMKKYTKIQKYLQEYQIKEIREFYENLPNRNLTYISKLLQYPNLTQIMDKNFKNDLKITVKEAQNELRKLSQFYLKWNEFYNSYKHGLRFFPSWPDPKTNDIMTGYFSKGDLNKFKIVLPQNHVEEAEELISFMFAFMSNAQEIFRVRRMEKKKEFSIQLLRHPKSKERFSYEK